MSTGEAIRPDVFAYSDYVLLLKDWIDYLKHCKDPISLREIAKRAGISPATISLSLSGKRKFGKRTLEKLLMVMRFQMSEEKFVMHLYTITESEAPQDRIEAMSKIERFREYRSSQKAEAAIFKYLHYWPHVIIREMSHLSGFKNNPEWIRSMFLSKLSPQKVEAALAFLHKSGFMKQNADGSVSLEDPYLDCDGEVLRLSLLDFHRQMLALSSEVLVLEDSDKRFIEGFTFSIEESKLPEVEKIMMEALDKVEKLEAKDKAGERVIHAYVGFTPLTKNAKESLGPPSSADYLPNSEKKPVKKEAA